MDESGLAPFPKSGAAQPCLPSPIPSYGDHKPACVPAKIASAPLRFFFFKAALVPVLRLDGAVTPRRRLRKGSAFGGEFGAAVAAAEVVDVGVPSVTQTGPCSS